MLTHVFIASSSLPSSAASRRRVRSRTGPRRRTRPGARSGLARGIDVKSQNRVPADLQRPSRSIASAPPCGAHVARTRRVKKLYHTFRHLQLNYAAVCFFLPTHYEKASLCWCCCTTSLLFLYIYILRRVHSRTVSTGLVSGYVIFHETSSSHLIMFDLFLSDFVTCKRLDDSKVMYSYEVKG